MSELEHISRYFLAANWYQTVVLYALIGLLVYANIVLIKVGERKEAGVRNRKLGDT